MQRKYAILAVAGALLLIAGLGLLWYVRRPPAVWTLDNNHSFAMVVPADQPAAEVLQRAREICAPITPYCTVIGWPDEASAPSKLEDWGQAQMDAEVFDYSFNHNGGATGDRAHWSCRRFPAQPRQFCLEALLSGPPYPNPPPGNATAP